MTLGEERFDYSANPDGDPTAPRLPAITNQSGSSSRLRTNVGQEYSGLLGQAQRGDRLGSMDFKVQNSFALAGPALG